MKQALLGLLFLFALIGFAGIGVAHLIWPDWFVKRSGARKGGSMLAEWNRLGFQAVGILLVGLVLYVLYSVLKH